MTTFKKKVFISGDLTGPGLIDKIIKFDNAEAFLCTQGHEPINPFKIDSNKLAPWPMRLEILSGCDAIFLLSNWLYSKESMMEKYYADVTGKEVLFESRIETENQSSQNEELVVSRIKGAIQEVTGLTFEQYTEEDRETNGFFCRMIFSIHCHKAGIDSKRIIHHIPRDRTTILHYLKKYGDECKYNAIFREIAERVHQKLYPEMSNCEKMRLRII
jgi:hypothetical protein